ncbi:MULTISPECIES: sll0787 family AIR synthase-like protein [Ramlibacter]|uniref:Sll0787 family AIR synthase-like protein n=1 Tax=Ramlibacter aquaticus TaxID=2780094 RepID=A0ABR9SAI9_9BURK|nr:MULTISPECIES: sll0787 family AIR synthase-like protein [Ramlibacter]MBE7939097.1 sll0787 family AIR synthase-like protein [Ramlibacter aquaticus]
MTDGELAALAATLRAGRGFAHKRDIGEVMATLAQSLPGGAADLAQAVAIGDDCAAIPDPSGHGWLLFAIEGFLDDFVQAMPRFAGWCGVMVNLSDICAMGGRPIAVVDALWSRGGPDGQEVLRGMADASACYGVPIVGGHSNSRSDRAALAVAILGRANRLLTSFNARPGDTLVMAIDLRGAYEEPHPFWNASTSAPAQRLRDDIELLPRLAESGLCDAAKDISNAGAVGTALMLLECSKVGAQIEVSAIPRPPGVALQRWLQTFPSFGFVFSVRPAQVEAVQAHFQAHGIDCASVGTVTADTRVWLRDGDCQALLWDVATEPFITAGASARPEGFHAG